MKNSTPSGLLLTFGMPALLQTMWTSKCPPSRLPRAWPPLPASGLLSFLAVVLCLPLCTSDDTGLGTATENRHEDWCYTVVRNSTTLTLQRVVPGQRRPHPRLLRRSALPVAGPCCCPHGLHGGTEGGMTTWDGRTFSSVSFPLGTVTVVSTSLCRLMCWTSASLSSVLY